MKSLEPKLVRAIVLDIEGTVTDIAFVRDTLFPYARAHLESYVARHRAEPDIAQSLADARILAGQPLLGDDETVALLLDWLDADRKATPLKTLQGLIWEDGYRSGSFRAPIYDDVPPALRAWQERGLGLHIYSSGSIAAQKLLFAHTVAGDLTGLLDGYYDTNSGAKTESDSYRTIARAIGLPAEAMLFLSDHPGEVAAAQGAGWQSLRVERGPDANDEPVRSFAELAL